MTPGPVHQPLSRWQAWYRAARPRTLTATYVPLGAAAVIAIQENVFNLFTFALALLGALLLQIAANLINEYYDFRRGAEDLKQAGQGMILKTGLLGPREVLAGAIITVLGGVIIGLFLVLQSGPLLLWIGLGGVLVVILYTAGPFPLAYNGLGELAVGLFMGPLMVLGAYYVMAAQFSWTPVLVGIPIGLMSAAILDANNVRDVEADRAVNKRTLAVIFGQRAARREYALLVGGAYASVALLILAGVMPWSTLLVALTLPEAVRLTRVLLTSDDTALLHRAQGGTARLNGRFGLWLVVGWGVALLLQTIAQG
jgi:1,4-dihydroxy-2-naphthoate octaprenyltransferase